LEVDRTYIEEITKLL